MKNQGRLLSIISCLAFTLFTVTVIAQTTPVRSAFPPNTSATSPAQNSTSQPSAFPSGTQATQTSTATAAPASGTPAEKHVWNLQNVEILKVIAEVSRETGKNFIVEPQVTGNITMVSSEPIGSDVVYPMFLSALKVLGYGAVENGAVIKIIPLKEAVQEGEFTKSKDLKNGDNLIVKVIVVNNVSAPQLAPSLTPLVPSWASVSVYAPSNTIIVSGSESVVKRVSDIIKSVDTPYSGGLDIVRLNYADAGEVVKMIEKLEQGHRFSSGDYSSSVSADVRSNSIILGGSEATRLHYKVLISQLDVSTQNTATDTQVFQLKFNPVTAILPVLRAVVRQSVNVNVVDNSSTGQQGSYNASASGGGATGPTASRIPEVTNASLNGGASSSGTDQSGVTIVGDVPNNAIIVTAPPNIMRTIKAVITQLDIHPKQILIQGIIAEVNADDTDRFGVEWSGNGNVSVIPGVVSGLGTGFIQGSSLGAVMAAINVDTANDILSTPSLTVLNNGNATINVGSSISVSNGSMNSAISAGAQPVQTFTYVYKDIGLALNVVPQITSEDSVQMKITQSNSTQLTTPSNSPGGNPNFSNQLLSTTVLVKNKDILVLGGLTQSQEQEIVTSIPFLSKIPLLGRLFEYREKVLKKRNLLIFLRPVVLEGSADADAITQAKYDAGRASGLATLREKHRIFKETSVLPAHPVDLPIPFSS